MIIITKKELILSVKKAFEMIQVANNYITKNQDIYVNTSLIDCVCSQELKALDNDLKECEEDE